MSTFTRGVHLTLQNLDASYKNINNRHARAQEFTQDSTPPASVRQFLVFRACALCRCKCLSIPSPLPAHHILSLPPAFVSLSFVVWMCAQAAMHALAVYPHASQLLYLLTQTITTIQNAHTHTPTIKNKYRVLGAVDLELPEDLQVTDDM